MADTDNVRAAKRAAERTGLITVIVIFALIAVAFVLLLTVGHRSFGSLWFGVAALALGVVSIIRTVRRRSARHRAEDSRDADPK